MADVQDALPIVAGFEYGLRLSATAQTPLFPFGCKLRAQVREFLGARRIMAELTTTDGIEWIDEDTVDIRIPASATTRLGNTIAVIDLVRTDQPPEAYLYLLIEIPVVQAVTGANP